MAWGLARYMFAPKAGDPAKTIRHQVEQREACFLAFAKWVMAQPEHPYAVLFRMARLYLCRTRKVRAPRWPRTTLRDLLRQGVYLTLDEFRGRAPIVRGGREIPAAPDVWSNPGVRGLLLSATSGSSTGSRLLTTSGVDLWVYREAYELLEEREFGYRDFPRIRLAPILPAGWGIAAGVMHHRFRRPMARWFAVGGGKAANLHYRAVTRYMVTQSRLLGADLPYPEYLGDNDFSPVAGEIARLLATAPGCYVAGRPSTRTMADGSTSDGGTRDTPRHEDAAGPPRFP